MKKAISSLPFVRDILKKLDNQYERDEFIIEQLKKIPDQSIILDAGCGNGRYKKYCNHLVYKTQDFGRYTTDLKKTIGKENNNIEERTYHYAAIDYVGNIWKIDEADATFDAILCTEVFEHIPYPNETIREFSRLLKPNGILILTSPSNCLRHMDPYFFYSGFSDRWYEKFLPKNGFTIEILKTLGDYYSWLSVEMARTAMSHSIIAKVLLSPAFLYFYNKKKSAVSVNTLCMGYLIAAKKDSNSSFLYDRDDI